MVAKVTSPEHFPVSYFRILDVVGAQGKTWRVPAEGPLQDQIDTQTGDTIPGWKLLNKLRGHFYAFKGSLKKFKDDPKFTDSYLNACRVACYLNRQQVCLEFRPTDNSWHAQALASGGILGDEPQPGRRGGTPVIAEQESLNKLLETLKIEGDLP